MQAQTLQPPPKGHYQEWKRLPKRTEDEFLLLTLWESLKHAGYYHVLFWRLPACYSTQTKRPTTWEGVRLTLQSEGISFDRWTPEEPKPGIPRLYKD